jgi:hypothetical protein
MSVRPRVGDVRICRDHRCSHHVEISADRWPDLSDIEQLFSCKGCGKRCAEVRPKFSQMKMGTDSRR